MVRLALSVWFEWTFSVQQVITWSKVPEQGSLNIEIPPVGRNVPGDKLTLDQEQESKCAISGAA
jgi:hypothetical protein